MDLNVSVITPALSDIQVVPTSFPRLKPDQTAAHSDESVFPCQAKSSLAYRTGTLTVDLQDPHADIFQTFPAGGQMAPC
ncbi:hypothetical protein PAL_GLEAN10001161 [Pteropus alecto]|uniref:Uncharacterized protein n=1 Tax=Pteropus alecto TaxID=9402 RepID=L5JT58_PTEAL|nr:hypothetical protein PAL_GLEAN10000082 [Pteropus alecto]ELK08259.1 hypothetical protein PAL_GLEAN10001160 [Pteropus alecto]ELK08260.1 hypothetical protein PAL_GLEAN10001161 [Pteropus alecto]